MPPAPRTVFTLCLWQFALSAAGQADTVYRWTDAQGHTHFGDRAPASQASTGIELPPADPEPPAGLRPGELSTLRGIERRQRARHAQAEAARREQRRQRDADLETCRAQRARLRLGRRHVDSKAISKYLRKHCW